MSAPGTGPPPTRQRGVAIASIAGGAALIIFIVQNTEDVKFEFLWFTFTWPLWLYTIVVAAFGGLAWIGAGVLRRHRRRVARRRARRD
ncbi:MAG TPA: LapA family protein [Acidimicrobiales bacterium]|nr:LapA family protein [Acidimicrobiales bacterium]